MDRKSVRFQDLSFIQESEEDQPEDTSVSVQGLNPHIPSPNQVGGEDHATPTTSGPSKPTVNNNNNNNKVKDTKTQSDSRRPAACPFGDRIAQERDGKFKHSSSSDSNNKNNNNKNIVENNNQIGKQGESSSTSKEKITPFPQNVIKLQEQEKKKAAKQKNKSGGVNPLSGKEKGSSFIITRNYLYGVTDNSTLLPSRNIYGSNKSLQDIDALEAIPPTEQHQQEIPQTQTHSLPYTYTSPSSTNFVPPESQTQNQTQSDVILTNVENGTPLVTQPCCDINSVSVGIHDDIPQDCSSSLHQHTNIIESVSSNPNQYHFSINHKDQQQQQQELYKPDSSLTTFINPFTAPNDQFYGSAAYQLKHTPQDTLSKPDVLKSSCVNQYLHNPQCLSQGHNPTYHYTSIKDPQPLLPSPTNPDLDNLGRTDTKSNNRTDKHNNYNNPIPPKDTRNDKDSTAPNCQFLRDNFSGLADSSGLHRPIDKAVSSSSPYESSENCDNKQQHQKQSEVNPPSPSSGVIGPVFVTPRRQVLPSAGSNPGLISDNNQHILSPPSPPAPQIPAAAATTSSTEEGLLITNAAGIESKSNTPPTTNAPTMNTHIGTTADIYGNPPPTPLSRFQEKEELQKLNDRLTSYVTRVRHLGQSVHNVDSSAFLRSTKVLEDEIVGLKKLYEAELASLRQEIETGSHERNSLQAQCNKHYKYAGEVQDRLAIETDKNDKLSDEVNVLMRKIGNLEAEVTDARIASQRPKEEMDHLHRTVENLTRESDQWKHRYVHEQVSRQEAEDRLQQLMKKVDFNDQVHIQQNTDYQARLDTSAATILSLESKVRELSTADVSVTEMLKQARLDTSAATILSLESKVRELSTADVSVTEMLKQVRETAETELKKYQIESEEQYSRNLSALKAQIDHDADSLSRYQTEKSQLMGNIGELQARIRNLEGQVQNMQHQKQSLEDAIAVERNRSADNIQQLERKLRDVQDMLVAKMREITNAREANIPLKAEIETLKALLEDEEKRLRVPLGIVPASVVQTSLPPTPATKDILASSITNQVLKPRTPPNSLAALSAQPTSVGFVTAASAASSVPCCSTLQQQQQQQIISSTSTTAATATAAGTVDLTQSAVESGGCKSVPSRPCFERTAASHEHQQPMGVSNVDSSSVAQGTMMTSCLSSAPLPSSQQQQQQAATTSSTLVSATYSYPPCAPAGSGIANPLYPYIPSPPLDVLYVPDALQTVDNNEDTLAFEQAAYGGSGMPGEGVVGYYDAYTPAFNIPMSGPRYQYEAHPSLNRLHMQPSPPISPKQTGGNTNTNVAARAKSAPATKPTHDSLATQISLAREKNLNLIPSDMGNGRDYFEEMFNDLQRDTLFSKGRPKSSPLERPVPSTYHDYTVSTSSAIGDLKILEVNQDGKFVRLVNDGPTEFEFGGYMVQQNVGGHPVAVFRFPPRTKFPPDSTITIWSSMNDPHLHNPPTDFYWKEQQKWGTGPECTTILCRANGQAVAWTTAAHRFTKDAFMENKTDGDDSNKFEYNKENNVDDEDDEALKELSTDANAPRPEPVYLRREKQQPPTLTASKHPHGASPTNGSHPHTGQARPLFYGNDNSSVNRQSRTQTTRPDPIPGQPYAGAPAQRVGSAPLRKMNNQGTIRTNVANRSTLEPGETSESPSPFMRPHSRFETGLEQVQSQHHPDFLPPMPRPPQASC